MKRFMGLFVSAFIVLSLFACGGGGSETTRADGTEITIDWTTLQNNSDTRNLDLTGDYDYIDYKFIGYVGQTYTITLKDFASNLDLWLQLDKGTYHESIDSSTNTGLTPETIVFVCDKDGVYIIRISGDSESQATSTNYTLTLSSI